MVKYSKEFKEQALLLLDDRDLRLLALEYAKEGDTLPQAAAVFKLNISTIIAWKRRYEATGDVRIKVRRPVNKKIIPEKHALFGNIEQGMRVLKRTNRMIQNTAFRRRAPRRP